MFESLCYIPVALAIRGVPHYISKTGDSERYFIINLLNVSYIDCDYNNRRIF